MSAETSNPSNNLHAVYEVLVHGEDMTDVTNWANTYQLYNTTVRAKDDQTLMQLIRRECTYLVETATMQILWQLCTGTNGQPPYSIEQGLIELDAVLP
jgi:hypothetical protein